MSCPYGPPNNFTENDLNMRRKAEILKYKHGNQLTKAQRYSMAARGKLIKKKNFATQSETFTDPNTLNIPKTKRIYSVVILGYPKHSFKKMIIRKEPDIKWYI